MEGDGNSQAYLIRVEVVSELAMKDSSEVQSTVYLSHPL